MININLNGRCKSIVDYLISSDDYVTIEELSRLTNLSRRSIYYDLDKINQWAEVYKIPTIEVIRTKGILLSSKQRELISSQINNSTALKNYVLSPNERLHVLICTILSGGGGLHAEGLAAYCDVSRNTILKDLKSIAKELSAYKLKIVYDIKKGYVCHGNNIVRRTVFLFYFHRIYHLYSKDILRPMDPSAFENNHKVLEGIKNNLAANYSKELIFSLALLLSDMKNLREELEIIKISSEEISKTLEYIAIRSFMPSLENKEAVYLTLQLLGSKAYYYTNGSPDSLGSLSETLVDSFEKHSAMTISNKELLVKSIQSHLNFSWPRYYYGIPLEGHWILKEIIKNNPTAYKLTKDSTKPLQEFFALPISDIEIAYLALYFSSFLQQSYSYRNKIRILIICLNGISTGNILKWEVSRLLPCVKIIGVEAKPSQYSLRDVCDLVISTVPLKTDVPVEVVSTRLTDENRISLLERVKDLGFRRDAVNSLELERLLSIIGRYVDSSKLSLIKEDILREINLPAPIESLPIEVSKNGGILKYLSPSKILITSNSMTWIEALNYCAEPLIKYGSIDASYTKEIIYQLTSFGPYMFLMPGLILAHGKPEMGVKKLDISLGVFKEPVVFDEEHKAKVILFLCPLDSESHIDILKDIMVVFKYADRVDDLATLSSAEAIIEKITELIGEKI